MHRDSGWKTHEATALYRSVGDKNKLFVHKLFHSEVRELFTIARALDTPKWKIGPTHIRIVDEDHSCLNTAGHPLRSLDVGGVNRSTQSKRRVVCNRDRLGFVFGRKDERDRAKEFLFIRWIVGCEISENSRLQKGSYRSRATSAKQNLCAMARCIIDLSKNQLQCAIRRQWAEGHT